MVPGYVEFYSGRSVMFSHDGGSYGARSQMEGYHERASWARGFNRSSVFYLFDDVWPG